MAVRNGFSSARPRLVYLLRGRIARDVGAQLLRKPVHAANSGLIGNRGLHAES